MKGKLCELALLHAVTSNYDHSPELMLALRDHAWKHDAQQTMGEGVTDLIAGEEWVL